MACLMSRVLSRRASKSSQLRRPNAREHGEAIASCAPEVTGYGSVYSFAMLVLLDAGYSCTNRIALSKVADAIAWRLEHQVVLI
jgi:hypothetical protein